MKSVGNSLNRGVPGENGYVESFNGKLHDELLNGELFYMLQEAQIIIEQWRGQYNTCRLHRVLGVLATSHGTPTTGRTTGGLITGGTSVSRLKGYLRIAIRRFNRDSKILAPV